jgi:hypothetical protein
MRRIPVGCLVICAALITQTTQASAQFGIAAKLGSTGVGGEVSYGIKRFALRGSVTAIPVEPKVTLSGIEYQIDPPGPLFTLGADFMVGYNFRLIGGLLIGADELTGSGDYNGTVNIGDQTYAGSGTITALIESSSVAPFLGIGLGRTIGRGVGVTLDLGAAILGETTVALSATGPITQQPNYEANRQREEQRIQDDIDKYVKVYPMLSLGLRVGVGPR